MHELEQGLIFFCLTASRITDQIFMDLDLEYKIEISTNFFVQVQNY